MRRCKFTDKVKYARPKKQAAATLRSHAAGSQDESPCRAIHKFKSNGKDAQLKLAAAKCNAWRGELVDHQAGDA